MGNCEFENGKKIQDVNFSLRSTNKQRINKWTTQKQIQTLQKEDNKIIAKLEEDLIELKNKFNELLHLRTFKTPIILV